MSILEGFSQLFEELDSKQVFINKFGLFLQTRFNTCIPKLKEKGFSIEYRDYLHYSKEQLDNFLISLFQKQNKVLNNDE